MTDLSDILARLGLSQYFERFVQEGFDTWETVLDITESDLGVLDVRLGHRRRLQREIASSRGQSAEQPLGSLTRLPPTEDGIPDREERTGSNKFESRDNVGSGKRKYRRHPKADENAPERASSAYVIFSNSKSPSSYFFFTGNKDIGEVSEVREDVKDQNLSFTEIAKLVGESWQILPAAEKEIYESQALAAKERYNTELIEYKKTAPYREYMEYLADFKAKMVKDQIGKRPKLQNQQYAANSSKLGGALPLCRARAGSLSSVDTYDSVISGQISPSTVNLHAPLLTQLPTVDSPFESAPTPTQRGCGSSAVPLSQQGGTTQGFPSVEEPRDPHPDYLPSTQQLCEMPLIGTQRPGSRPHGRIPSAVDLPPVPISLMQSNHGSSLSSLSSGYNTSSSSLYAPITPQEDQAGRAHRALPPPPVNSASSSASQGYFDSPTRPANPHRAGHHSLSPPFQIPPLPSQTTTAMGIKVHDSEEGSSGSLGSGTLAC